MAGMWVCEILGDLYGVRFIKFLLIICNLHYTILKYGIVFYMMRTLDALSGYCKILRLCLMYALDMPS